MKKLIEELEIVLNYNKSTDDKVSFEDGIIEGLEIALDIVRNHNPWHDVAELPSCQEKRLVSEKVFVANECDKATCEGYYDFDICRWRRYHDDRIISPTRWTYLPELPK